MCFDFLFQVGFKNCAAKLNKLVVNRNLFFNFYKRNHNHFWALDFKSNLKSFIILAVSLECSEACCNELAGPISASLRPGNTATFEEMSQRWQAVGNTVSDLTGSRFELWTSRFRYERVTARPTV